MAERGLKESQNLWVAYLAKVPNPPAKLDHSDIQQAEIAKSLARVNDNPTAMLANGMEISSMADGTGSKIIILNHPGMQLRELRVVAVPVHELPTEIFRDDETLKDFTQPYGPKVGPYSAHMLRLLMIGTGALGEGNRQAMVEAVQAGEDLPRLGLKPDGFGGRFLRKLGLAATYDIKPDDVSGRYVLTVEKPGQSPVEETWQELSGRFGHGTASFMVIGRVANVGRVRPEPVATTAPQP